MTVTIIWSSVGTLSVVGILLYLFKNWLLIKLRAAIQSEYDAQLATVKAKHDRELELFKAQLEYAASARNIRMTRAFDETVDTISETYKKLLAFKESVRLYTSLVEYPSMGTREERRDRVVEKYNELLNYYAPRKPFLPKRTVDSIDAFLVQLGERFKKFMLDVDRAQPTSGESTKSIDTWTDSHDYMTKDVPPILVFLEEDMRAILGVTDTHEINLSKS